MELLDRQGHQGMDIQLGVNTYDQTQGGESYSRTTVDYKVTCKHPNDRVSLRPVGPWAGNEKKQDVSAEEQHQGAPIRDRLRHHHGWHPPAPLP
ncbi:MAG: hypothetical protein R2818_10665 [Flavobacteriales bacterium]